MDTRHTVRETPCQRCKKGMKQVEKKRCYKCRKFICSFKCADYCYTCNIVCCPDCRYIHFMTETDNLEYLCRPCYHFAFKPFLPWYQ